MKNLIYFIAGILFVTLLSVTTINGTVRVVPEKPRTTFVKAFNNGSYTADYMQRCIVQKIKEGYIVKSTSISLRPGEGIGLLIMEKY